MLRLNDNTYDLSLPRHSYYLLRNFIMQYIVVCCVIVQKVPTLSFHAPTMLAGGCIVSCIIEWVMGPWHKGTMCRH